MDSSLAQGLNLDGKNMWDFISSENKKYGERELYLRTPDQIMLRVGDWKLIHFGNTIIEGRNELFNLKNDPNETTNVVKGYPKVRDELFKELENQVKIDHGF